MSYIGTTVSVAQSAAVTEDAASYGAVAVTEIGRIVSHTALGDSYQDQAQTLLKTGRTVHDNGAADGGEVTLTVDGEDFDDAGVAILEAAEGTNQNHVFKFAGPKQTRYLQGIIRGIRTLNADASTKSGLEIIVGVNTGIVRVASA